MTMSMASGRRCGWGRRPTQAVLSVAVVGAATVVTISSRFRRSIAVLGATFSIIAGVAFVGCPRADAAVVAYFPCPQTVPGMGCGISGSVGPGHYTAEFKFVTTNGYEFEPFVDYCATECPVFHWAIGRQDRTPAGYQIVSDSPFTLGSMLSK